MEGIIIFMTFNPDFYTFLLSSFLAGSIESIRVLHQRKAQDIKTLINKTVDHFGSLHIAVNNAAYVRTMCPLQEIPE